MKRISFKVENGNSNNAILTTLYYQMNNWLLNLESYKVIKTIFKSERSEELQIQEEETDTFYTAKTFKININELSDVNESNFHIIFHILSKLSSPSIPKLIGLSLTNFSKEPNPTIVIEFSPNGQLINFLRKERKKINSNSDFCRRIFIIIYGIAFSMNYLHNNSIVHRNLTPKSILLDDSFNPKISSFKHSILLNNNEKHYDSKVVGKAPYIAPEVWMNNEYSKASDVYSFSLILYEIITNRKPFKRFKDADKIKDEVVNNKYRPHLGKKVPRCYRRLIQSCWSQNPKKRPTFKQILSEIRRDSEFILDEFDKQESLKFIELPYYQYDEFHKEFFYINQEISNLYQEEDIEISNHDQFQSDSDQTESDSIVNDTNETISIVNDTNEAISNSNHDDPTQFYVDLIKKNSKLDELDRIIKNSNSNLNENDSDLSKVLFDPYPFIDISNFEKIEKISDFNVLEVIKIKEKTTGKFYIAKSFKFKQYDLLNYINLKNVVGLLDQMKHPSLLNFVGYSPFNLDDESKPVIIYDFQSKKILNDIREQEIDLTHNILITYGIATGMQYLHSHDILHRSLCSRAILLDENFYPKIDSIEFCFKSSEKNGIHKSYDSPPETMIKDEYTKSSEVYVFSMLMYEIFTGQIPFQSFKDFEAIKSAVLNDHYRPPFNDKVPKFYQKLIELCWSSNPEERPTFSQIIDTLKSNEQFIELISSKDEYFKYIKANSDANYSSILENNKFPIFDLNLGTVVNKKEYIKVNVIGDIIYNNIYRVKEIKTGLYFGARDLQIFDNEFSKSQFTQFYNLLYAVSKIDHFSFLKFIGFTPFNFLNEPKPVIITDYQLNVSLEYILENEREGHGNEDWDWTLKLIATYGIASGMKYLHSHDILCRSLCPKNIFLDENLYPKIDTVELWIDLCQKKANKDTIPPQYISPETFEKDEYTKSSQVYSFAMIMYEIFTDQKPFQSFEDFEAIKSAVVNDHYRPPFVNSIPECYQRLIESCWSPTPEERPTFSQIVDALKSDNLITKEVDEEYYKKYIQSVDPNNFKSETKQIPKRVLDLKNYEKEESIGKGGFSTVYKIQLKGSNEIYAAKVFRNSLDFLSSNGKMDLRREIEIMAQLNHQAILKFYGYSPVNFSNKPKLTLITEYAQATLNKMLEFENDGLSPKKWDSTRKLIVIYGIASGMKYLHSLDILHRDLKPENILLDDYLFPKIADFGLSKQRHINDVDKSYQSGMDLKGTPAYIPPETFSYYIYSKQGDVYAFAMIVYEIIVGVAPWKDVGNFYQILMKIANKERPKIINKIPGCYRKLIKMCWSEDMYKRPSFSEIVDYLATNEAFKEGIDVEDFQNYIEFVDGHLPVDISRKVFTKFDDIQLFKAEKEYLELSPTVKIIDINNYQKMKKLDEGGFGKENKVINKNTEATFAAKVSIKEFQIYEKIEKINFSREVNIMSKLNHESIIKFYGYSQLNFKGKPKPTFLMEIATNGSLKKALNLERQSLSQTEWNNTKKFINIYGIASVMKYLHSLDIIHRDLKTNNIFLDDYLYPKLSDFGFSKEILQKQQNFNTNQYLKGTHYYIAPEIYGENKYSKASDVYAFAMILYEIITNETKLGKFTDEQQISIQVMVHHYRPPFIHKIPECYKNLIEKCWSEDPKKRPSFDEIVMMLRSDPRFMFEDVDFDEFLLYTELIGDDYIVNKKIDEPEKKLEKDVKKVSLPVSDEKINEHTINVFNKIFEEEIGSISPTNNYIDINNYEQQEIIRKGEFNKVYKVVNKNTRKTFAARISNINMNEFSKEDMQMICNEMNRIAQLKHHSILKIIGFSPSNYKNRSNPVFITEFTSKNSLYDIICFERQHIKYAGWDLTKKLINIYGIASGMKYFHSQGILHRNLRPSNIILDNFLYPKLSDFGVCNHLLIMNSITFKSISKIKSSSYYQAPEILNSEEYTEESDVYSFAMVAYEILTNDQPFCEIRDFSKLYREVVVNGSRPKFRKPISDCYRNLIECCWCQNPNDRLTFDQIVDVLQNERDFVTPEINQNEYYKYVDRDLL